LDWRAGTLHGASIRAEYRPCDQDNIEPFGLSFPKTRILSALARSSLGLNSPTQDPDNAILLWMEREEQLFKRLERRIVAERIASGFMAPDGADVDGFIKFSLSVQNTRKSRAGLALENHLQCLFELLGLEFQRGVETENRNKPDFLFPGQVAYRDADFPTHALTMLGAKSTLEDRWRQVLSEAKRIETKHLITLEPGISENQTNEMREKRLQLIVPSALHHSYRPTQRQWLWDLREFIAMVRSKSA
jgi:EcoRII C terminal